MAGLVSLASLFAIGLTSVGTFRFGSRFYGSSFMGFLLSGFITTLFLIFFHIYLLALGTLPFILGTFLLVRNLKDSDDNEYQTRTNRQRPSPGARRGNQLNRRQNSPNQSSQAPDAKTCEDCGRKFRTSRSTCEHCGGILLVKRND